MAGLSELRVGDEHFLVASMIERCPKVMMLRELVKNAVEAAQTAPEGRRWVEIGVLDIEGGRKLAIRNSGVGLDAGELHRMCDIASSIRKTHTLDQNFGMGAKVASLPSNKHGMRYRSCHEGHVHEVVLGQRGGVYGRLVLPDADGRDADVRDVTAQVRAAGGDVAEDWTEVVLMGNRPGQDTAADPYEGAPAMGRHWVAEELYKRFFRLPEDVEVRLDASLNVQGRTLPFRPIASRLARDYTRHEAVETAQGFVIHYVYDAEQADLGGAQASWRDALQCLYTNAAIVYRDEMYDVQQPWDWRHRAPAFGITFGAPNIAVYIELPPQYPAVPDGYRQFLRERGGDQHHVQIGPFGGLVNAHRPEWLIEVIANHAPSQKVEAEIYAGLDQLIRALKIPRRTRAVEAPSVDMPQAEPRPEGADSEQVVPEQAADEDASRAEEPDPVEGVRPEPPREAQPEDASPEDDFEAVPEILLLRGRHECEQRGIIERAGRYYPESHQIFLNCDYRAVTSMQERLMAEFAWAGNQEVVAREATLAAQQALALRVGRAVVYALSRHQEFPHWEVDQALSPATLSVLADDYEAALPGACAAIQAALELNGIAPR